MLAPRGNRWLFVLWLGGLLCALYVGFDEAKDFAPVLCTFGHCERPVFFYLAMAQIFVATVGLSLAFFLALDYAFCRNSVSSPVEIEQACKEK
jgi:hypothetical protein